MEALRRSVGGTDPAKASKPSKKPRKAASGQKEMLMPIEGKKAKERRRRRRRPSRSGSRPSNSARPAGSSFIQRGFT
jgi:DNA end-binding protein Ku